MDIAKLEQFDLTYLNVTGTEDGVVRVVLSRPEKRNALNADTIEELIEVFSKLPRMGARAVVLAAEGDHFLASFIDQPGIPLVSVRDLGDGRFEFLQSRLVTGVENGLASQSWIMPVMYRYRSGDGVSLGTLVLDSETKLVDLGSDVEWILPNADQLGYFRWTIPTDMMNRLGDDAPTQLNVRERMGMLSNLWALLATDGIDAEDFLGALDGMSSDSDPGVINALLDQLGNVRQTFITELIQ